MHLLSLKGPKANSNVMTPDQELYELEQLNQSIEETIAENIKCQTQSQANENNTSSNDKWYKFNDTSVEEINFTDATLADECFGGTFISTSEFKVLPEERVRYWNAYMLFYRELDYNNQPKQQQQQRNVINSMDKLRQRRDLITRDDKNQAWVCCNTKKLNP